MGFLQTRTVIVCVMVYQLHPVALYTGSKPSFLVVERFANKCQAPCRLMLSRSQLLRNKRDGDVKNCRLKRDLLTDNT